MNAEYHRSYYAEHRAAILARRIERREAIAKSNRLHYVTHRDRIRARQNAYKRLRRAQFSWPDHFAPRGCDWLPPLDRLHPRVQRFVISLCEGAELAEAAREASMNLCDMEIIVLRLRQLFRG